MEWKKGIIVLWILFGASLAITAMLFLSSLDEDREYAKKTVSSDALEVYAWYDERETFETLSRGFMETYPSIKVNMHYFPNSESQQSYLTLLNGEEPADIIAIATSADAAQLINKGYITVLDRFIAKEGSNLSGLSPLIESLKQDGQVYMMPYRSSYWVVYYNKKIFDFMGEKYPEGEWTWDEYAHLAQRLTSQENGWYGSLNFEGNFADPEGNLIEIGFWNKPYEEKDQ